jgi:hypothetical protein
LRGPFTASVRRRRHCTLIVCLHEFAAVAATAVIVVVSICCFSCWTASRRWLGTRGRLLFLLQVRGQTVPGGPESVLDFLYAAMQAVLEKDRIKLTTMLLIFKKVSHLQRLQSIFNALKIRPWLFICLLFGETCK